MALKESLYIYIGSTRIKTFYSLKYSNYKKWWLCFEKMEKYGLNIWYIVIVHQSENDEYSVLKT